MTTEHASQKKKARSPAYPALDLAAAIELAGRLLREADRHPVSTSVAVGTWGFGPQSSGGKLAVSALSKYGLIEDEGRGDARTIRLSERGYRILRLSGAEHLDEQMRYIREAALAPPIHREIITKFPGALPTDSVIGRWLEFERGFYAKSVPEVLRVFRSTLAFAGLDRGGKIELPPADTTHAEDHQDVMQTPPPTSRLASKAAPSETAPIPVVTDHITRQRSEFRLPLGDGQLAVLSVPFPMTEPQWARMKRVLEAMKDGIVGA